MTDHPLLRLTPVLTPVEDGWWQAQLREMPGVITAAPTKDEARAALVDALKEFLLSFGPESAAADPAAEALQLTVHLVPAA